MFSCQEYKFWNKHEYNHQPIENEKAWEYWLLALNIDNIFEEIFYSFIFSSGSYMRRYSCSFYANYFHSTFPYKPLTFLSKK